MSNLSVVLQLLKKLINSGDTSCLRPLLSVTSLQDRALLEKHCHTASKRILCGQQAESAIREAVAYLSIAIMASGNEGMLFFYSTVINKLTLQNIYDYHSEM